MGHWAPQRTWMRGPFPTPLLSVFHWGTQAPWGTQGHTHKSQTHSSWAYYETGEGMPCRHTAQCLVRSWCSVSVTCYKPHTPPPPNHTGMPFGMSLHRKEQWEPPWGPSHAPLHPWDLQGPECATTKHINLNPCSWGGPLGQESSLSPWSRGQSLPHISGNPGSKGEC